MSRTNSELLMEAAFTHIDTTSNSPFRTDSIVQLYEAEVDDRKTYNISFKLPKIQLQNPFRNPFKRLAAPGIGAVVQNPGETLEQAKERSEREAAERAKEQGKEAIKKMSHADLAAHLGMKDAKWVEDNREDAEEYAHKKLNKAINEALEEELGLKAFKQNYDPKTSSTVGGFVKNTAKAVGAVAASGLHKLGKASLNTAGKLTGRGPVVKGSIEEDNINNRNYAVEQDIAEIMKNTYWRKAMQEEAMNIYIASSEQREDWLNVGRGSMDVLDYINKYKV